MKLIQTYTGHSTSSTEECILDVKIMYSSTKEVLFKYDVYDVVDSNATELLTSILNEYDYVDIISIDVCITVDGVSGSVGNTATYSQLMEEASTLWGDEE